MPWFGGRIKKTPTLIQMETVECGAASLGIILSYYGKHLPLEVLRRECGVNRDGCKASNIMKAARRMNLEAKGVRCSADELHTLPLPAIIHWEFNHFLVLEGIDGDRVHLNDPGFGHRRMDMKEFRSSYTGVAMLMKPGEGFTRGGTRFNVVKEIAKKLVTEKGALVFILVASLLAVMPGLAHPVFSQLFLDEILSGKHQDWLRPLLFGMFLTGIIDVSLTGLRAWCLTRWQTRLTLGDSSSFFWHILRLPVTFFQQRYSGEIAVRVHFNETVADVLTGRAATVALDLLIAVFFLFLLLNYSVRLTLIGVFFSLLNLFLLSVMRKRLLELSMRIQQDTGKAMGSSIGGLQAIETIKANGNENDFFAKWAGFQARRIQGSQQLDMAAMALSVGPMFFNAVNTAVIMLIGGFEIMDGMMTAGVFMAFRSLMGNFEAPIQKIFSMGQMLQSTEMQMQRLDDVKNYPVEETSHIEPKAGDTFRRLNGMVQLRDISFGYSPLDPPLISYFDLTILPGRWVALVGGSGSGKSTVSNVANGLFPPWSGEVLFDGKQRQEIPKAVLVNSIASVSQDVQIFSGTARENISLFDPSIPDPDIIKAAQDAMIHDDLTRLEGGYEHVLREGGSNLSGGQRQRLVIARALAINPSILIFDEATSALDPVTEEQVLTNIRRRGCTCLMVAHRLSAFRDCDEIIVLDYGKVVQRGTHSEMIKMDSPYRRLVANQAGVLAT